MANSDNVPVQYATFTHSGKRYRQNQDVLLLPGAVQQKAGFWQGQLNLNLNLNTSVYFAIADGAGVLPSAAKANRVLLHELMASEKSPS